MYARRSRACRLPMQSNGRTERWSRSIAPDLVDDDDARLDAGIDEPFANKAEGWEFLTVLPDDALAQLRVDFNGAPDTSF